MGKSANKMASLLKNKDVRTFTFPTTRRITIAKHSTTMFDDIEVVESFEIAPDAAKVSDALSRIGYKIEEAIADLADNAIDAGATKILVRFVHDGTSIERILIADNGHGMSKEKLLSAMQFGSSRDRQRDDLGKFGMGLKTAALSQGRSLTIVTRKKNQATSCRWTKRGIAEGWQCQLLDPRQAEKRLDELQDQFGSSGCSTLVAIDELDHIRTNAKGLEATLQQLQRKLSVHLGMTFHRFLDDPESLFAQHLELIIDASEIDSGETGFSVPVEPLNPFDYDASGDKAYPLEFVLQLSGLPELRCTAHIWPPNQRTSGYLLGGGNVAKRQGFYFYRNNRLIQAGGWNGWRESESDPHLSLARVSIELSMEFDADFRLNVQKSALDAPESFRNALDLADCPLGMFVKRADEVYRQKTIGETTFVPVLGRGFPAKLRKKGSAKLTSAKSAKHEINIFWAKLPIAKFFTIDKAGGNIILNVAYRKRILNGNSAGLNDAPVLKILLFLLLREDLLRERNSKQVLSRIDTINDLLLLSLQDD